MCCILGLTLADMKACQGMRTAAAAAGTRRRTWAENQRCMLNLRCKHGRTSSSSFRLSSTGSRASVSTLSSTSPLQQPALVQGGPVLHIWSQLCRSVKSDGSGSLMLAQNASTEQKACRYTQPGCIATS